MSSNKSKWFKYFLGKFKGAEKHQRAFGLFDAFSGWGACKVLSQYKLDLGTYIIEKTHRSGLLILRLKNWTGRKFKVD